MAVAALAGLTERFALAKWSRRRPDTGVDAPLAARASSAARSWVFRVKRGGVNAADRNQVAERALGTFLRARGALRTRRRRVTQG